MTRPAWQQTWNAPGRECRRDITDRTDVFGCVDPEPSDWCDRCGADIYGDPAGLTDKDYALCEECEAREGDG